MDKKTFAVEPITKERYQLILSALFKAVKSA
jgi:hypothetical protein